MDINYKYVLPTKEDRQFNKFLDMTIIGTAYNYFNSNKEIMIMEEYNDNIVVDCPVDEDLLDEVNNKELRIAMKSLKKMKGQWFLFFEDKLNGEEITKKRGINANTVYIVSRVLNNKSNYKVEKQNRVKEQKIIHKEKTKKYISSKREKEYVINQKLKQDHIQASIELSGGKIINNRSFRKWNSSIYKFNTKKNYYEIDKKVIVGYDVPKIVK